MIFIDRFLMSGVGFVLDKLATLADAEVNDTDRLREMLLDAQMRLELGEIDEEEFSQVEETVLTRLREARRRELEQTAAAGMDVVGVEITVDGLEDGAREA